MTRFARELAALTTASASHLRETWETLAGTPAPLLPNALLRRLVAQRLQEKRHGGLPLLVARQLDRMSEGQGKEAVKPQPAAVVLSTGTRLVREWNGTTVAVEVLENGFSWNGQHYRSLTQIARAVTGARWSGPRFFGLKRHG